MRRVAAALVLAAALGCGKRGDPLPPLARTPQPVKDLSVAQRGPELEIRYMAPRTTTSGVRLELHSVEILTARAEGDFAKTALVEVRKVAPGETVSATQPLPPPGTRLRVAARAVAGRDRSALTPIVTLLVEPPPAAPADLTARLTPEAVVLAWTGTLPSPPPAPSPSPAASPTAASPAPSPVAPAATTRALTPSPAPAAPRTRTPGFRVFRRDPIASYEAPMNPVPIPTNAFEDRTAAGGQRWCYAVRAAASVDPVVESAASNEVCIDITDVTPPAIPAGVATLAGAEVVEVSWSPSAEPDLAGYRVYRAPEGGAPARLAELPAGQTTWRDASPARGGLHLYTVTAFDKSGNESAPSKPAEGHLP
jgi:hypothetical protein